MKGQTMVVPVLCLMFFWVGCASKGKSSKPDPPQSGQCGYVQDRCVIGKPSNTGDNNAPYGWTCLGIRGGADASCSVPTAPLSGEDKFFAGEHDLVTRVNAAGPLKGKLVIFDPTFIDGNEHTHAAGVKSLIRSIGVPEENLAVTDATWDFFVTDEWRDIRDQTLVISHPTTFVASSIGGAEWWIPFIREHDILHVAAAGNVGSFDGWDRDLWYPDHPWWESHSWENVFEGFATGKLIIATFAEINRAGTASPNLNTIRCGLAMEYCYSVQKHERHHGTSSATSALSALTFYLSQLWETPQEVVGVLNVCAEDVGEPGIDEEYGRGIVSVVCDTVRNREVGVVAQSLQVSSVSPVFNQMTQNSASSVPFRPFFSLNGKNPETMTGHLGGEISVQDTDVFLSAGAGYLPLGIHSSLLPIARTPFIEFGTRQAVFTGKSHRFFLLGTYGYSGGDGFFARVGHLGAQYQYGLNIGTLSFQAGHRLVQGTIGIPGHREAGAAPTPFIDGNPEVRFSFTLR